MYSPASEEDGRVGIKQGPNLSRFNRNNLSAILKRADQLCVGDRCLFPTRYATNTINEVTVDTVRSLELIGDDVEIHTFAGTEWTTSVGNTLIVMPAEPF